MSDVAYKLRGLAIGMASPSLGRDTVSQATDHIERLEADNARLQAALRLLVGIMGDKDEGGLPTKDRLDIARAALKAAEV